MAKTLAILGHETSSAAASAPGSSGVTARRFASEDDFSVQIDP